LNIKNIFYFDVVAAKAPKVVPIPPPNTGAAPKPPLVVEGAALAPKAI